MNIAEFTAWHWLVLVQHEMLLFAGIFFLVGSIDEILVDCSWLWLKLTGRLREPPACSEARSDEPLTGPGAVFIPTWQEAAVIGATVNHALEVWRQHELTIYVGCYRNDGATIGALLGAVQTDARVRLVVHDVAGPTTKADCLNRLYRALCLDESRLGRSARMVVLHDAEDMVDPAALVLLDQALNGAELAQIPVLPMPQAGSRWIGSHYCEEFAEAHGKAMVVRDALGAGIPLAGVGCAIARAALERLAERDPSGTPFAADCLTEDYELGLSVADWGGRARFLRYRHPDGSLVATRAFFPSELETAVRQKTRWIHGIAFQAWDRLGWRSRPAEVWMRMRDRRGPLAAFVLSMAYALLIVSTIVWVLGGLGFGAPIETSPALEIVLWLNFASLAWRIVWRFGFTAREYGWAEGLRSILRIPVTNIIAIMAGRRAVLAYIRSLRGWAPTWDKTEHRYHPARSVTMQRTATAS
ncbi:glycosyl transferase family protein [Parerythrobacter lacustris]|uniref:Glycosyl transferase family protein n=1 Tax=Parerythrobacter lacustris TaxID=2969984 RepID=A0ABT1XT30_9SPHN|nr:glycosyl transferase family protein [Parerythrobacter lacustris]